MNTVTIVLNEEEQKKLKEQYHDAKICKTPPYANYQIKLSDCTITAYQSGKVVFQGEGANYHSGSYQKATETNAKTIFPQCGSDEVGTGDFFGPVVVCACYIDQILYDKIKELKIMDSKQLKDEQILKIAPTLMEILPHSILILNNEKYNSVHNDNNMNAIKAKLHNAAYVHLEKKLKQLPDLNVVDQFAVEKTYFSYLKNEKKVIRKLHFETKAESKYISVACASMIARYAFLKEMSAMEKLYDMVFPKGANKEVNESAKKFCMRYGENQLNKVAKIHFANTKKIC